MPLKRRSRHRCSSPIVSHARNSTNKISLSHRAHQSLFLVRRHSRATFVPAKSESELVSQEQEIDSQYFVHYSLELALSVSTHRCTIGSLMFSSETLFGRLQEVCTQPYSVSKLANRNSQRRDVHSRYHAGMKSWNPICKMFDDL